MREGLSSKAEMDSWVAVETDDMDKIDQIKVLNRVSQAGERLKETP
jgi:hypothetical protein